MIYHFWPLPWVYKNLKLPSFTRWRSDVGHYRTIADGLHPESVELGIAGLPTNLYIESGELQSRTPRCTVPHLHDELPPFESQQKRPGKHRISYHFFNICNWIAGLFRESTLFMGKCEPTAKRLTKIRRSTSSSLLSFFLCVAQTLWP